MQATNQVRGCILGEASGDNYIRRVTGGPVTISGGGATGIRIQYSNDVYLTGMLVDGCNGAGVEIQNTSDGTDTPTNAKVSLVGGGVSNCGGIGISTAASNVDNLQLIVNGMQFEANTTNHIRADSSSRLVVTGCNFVDDLSQVVRAQTCDFVSVVGNVGTATATTSTTSSTVVKVGLNTWQGETYTPTNVSADRSFDADTVAIAELADVVGTLIADLQAQGVVE